MNRDQNAPVLAILVLVSLLMGLVLFLQLLTQKDLYFVNKLGLGIDYREVYKGSLRLREGRSPYLVARYVYPPLPAVINVPATHWPFHVVKYIVSLSVLLTVGASAFLLHRIFVVGGWREDVVFVFAIAGIMSLSYPLYFLFDRGNIDGFVLLLTCLGLFALRGSGWLAGVLFGLAVGVKLYPILIVLPLAAKLRWKPLASMAACLLVLFLLGSEHWITFLYDRVLTRGSQFKLYENGSIASTFLYLGRFTADLLRLPRAPVAWQIAELSLPFYLMLLGLLFVRDAMTRNVDRQELCADVALYFPFMVAVPQLAYHYELVWLLVLIPVVGWFWANAIGRARRGILAFIVCGIALSQFQAVAAEKLLENVYAQVVPGFGLLLVMIGVVALWWETLRAGTIKPDGTWAA